VPRSGKINANMKFFSKQQLQEVSIGCGKSMRNYGYYHLVAEGQKEEEGIPKWIRNFNNKAMTKQI